MDSEKDLLKRDLANAEKKEEVEAIMEDAKELGHEDIVALAKEKLEAILTKAQLTETTSTAQVAQVENMGGSAGEIEKRTKGVDQIIDEVKADATARIGDINGMGTFEDDAKMAKKALGGYGDVSVPVEHHDDGMVAKKIEAADEELKKAYGILVYLQEEVIDIQQRHDQYMKKAQNEATSTIDKREARLSVEDCVKTKKHLEKRVVEQRADIERLNIRLRELRS